MNNSAEWASCDPICRDAMKQLLTRHPVGPKHLLPPAPTEEQVCLAVAAALRAPDHQKLVPFRFVLIPDDARPLLGELFADSARRSGKTDDEIAIERDRAMPGPLLLAFVVRIENDHPRVPPHEQWLAAGGALSNFLTALHVMGFGAKMLSGRKAADPAICNAFCGSGETLVGWIAAGTASQAPHPRENDNPDAILRRWQPPQGLQDASQS
ncbi:MAG: nitroreductase [Betaproteobacteria bacterium]|nr:nitroreductase [Betaproteobacteria bacterium]